MLTINWTNKACKIQRISNKIRIEGITLFTTTHCNLDCVYCFTKERRKQITHIGIDEWKNIIFQAKQMMAKWVIFAGPGEPSLNAMNLRLIEYVNSLNMRSILFTNGTLITKDTVDFLYSNNVYIIFKLPSFNPRIYDFLSGKLNSGFWKEFSYSYNRKHYTCLIPEGLKLLLKKNNKLLLNNRAQSLCIESVITKHNLTCLIDIAKFVKAYKLDFLIETVILPFDVKKDDLVPNDKEYEFLFKELRKHLKRKFVLSQRNHQCYIRKNPVIWENGEIAFCFVQEAHIGNIRNNTLKDLWTKRISLKDNKLEVKNVHGFRNCLGREHIHAIQEGLYK